MNSQLYLQETSPDLACTQIKLGRILCAPAHMLHTSLKHQLLKAYPNLKQKNYRNEQTHIQSNHQVTNKTEISVVWSTTINLITARIKAVSSMAGSPPSTSGSQVPPAAIIALRPFRSATNLSKLWRWKGLSSSVVFSDRNLANAPTVNPLMSMTCSKPNHSFQSGTTPRKVISSCCWVKMPWAKKEDDELQGLITCAKHRRRSNPLCWYCSKEFWGKFAYPLCQHSEYIPISATHSLPFCVLFGTHLKVGCPLLEKYEMQIVKKTHSKVQTIIAGGEHLGSSLKMEGFKKDPGQFPEWGHTCKTCTRRANQKLMCSWVEEAAKITEKGWIFCKRYHGQVNTQQVDAIDFADIGKCLKDVSNLELVVRGRSCQNFHHGSSHHQFYLCIPYCGL